MDDREKLYQRCAEIYLPEFTPAVAGDIARLPEFRRTVDTAYEAGLIDGAKMLAADIHKRMDEKKKP